MPDAMTTLQNYKLERDHYRKALEKIASGVSHHPGDLVDIARKALDFSLNR